ncbi:MAG TPA: hypothetical protein VK438_12050 [Xanthobacteraceae bacterium]|nr:hypothetical protein [Xanthobacteraceae bacterium]
MVLRFVVVLSVIAAATPSLAETMGADAARRFVANKQFSFTCFEGSVGSGRIGADGSVAGVIRIRGEAPTRFIHLPAGTLFARGESVCSYVKGALFNPCFNLEKTGANTFRGAVSGFGFAYCDFVRRSGPHEMLASFSPLDEKLPMPTPRSIRRGAKAKHDPDETASTTRPGAPAPAAAPSAAPAPAPSAPAAAPTTPVTTVPLPSMGETGMRGSQ